MGRYVRCPGGRGLRSRRRGGLLHDFPKRGGPPPFGARGRRWGTRLWPLAAPVKCRALWPAQERGAGAPALPITQSRAARRRVGNVAHTHHSTRPRGSKVSTCGQSGQAAPGPGPLSTRPRGSKVSTRGRATGAQSASRGRPAERHAAHHSELGSSSSCVRPAWTITLSLVARHRVVQALGHSTRSGVARDRVVQA